MTDIEIAQLTDRFMRRIHAALNVSAPAFDTHRIGPAGGILLLTLADMEPARIQDVVARMARDKAQITRGIQMLERRGLLTRQDLPRDGRVSMISLTGEGRSTVLALQTAVAEALDDILAPLTENDRTLLKEILSRL
ncbi:MAG: MarR family transcriptional regulator [Pseudomonadota bacterium]